jgi:hypothetical protein
VHPVRISYRYFRIGGVAAAVAILTRAIGVAAVLGAESELVIDPVRALLGTTELPGGNVVRITRDYNNDGLKDIAVGFEGTCGNKTCSLELFLQVRDGRYKHIGTIGGLPFAFRLVPVVTGTARLETCTAIGGIVSFSSTLISLVGVQEEPGRTLSEDETDILCRWPGEYTWDVCDAAQLRSTTGCSWTRRSWP